MKPLLLKRGDVMREYGISDYMMRRIERGGSLKRVPIRGWKCRIYRRRDVEGLIFGQKGAGNERSA